MGYKEKGFKGNLTSEKLKACFPNQFDLVNSAIACARNIIRSENRAAVTDENQNVAAQAIEELEIQSTNKNE